MNDSTTQSIIYLDNAATTRTSKRAILEVEKYNNLLYANPSSAYKFAKTAADKIDEVRYNLSRIINCNKDEIYFTSGGSESDNWAIRMTAYSYAHKGMHIITSAFEHNAVLNPCKSLEEEGFEVTYIKPDNLGIIQPERIAKHIRKDTILISIMASNNEIGTLQNLYEIGMLANKYGIIFHTDAVQAICHIPIDVRRCKISLLSASAHKFNGPKGVGFLYISNNISINPLILGGTQENGMRAGTSNVPGIAGMGAAAYDNYINLRKNGMLMIEKRDYMIDNLMHKIKGCTLNGDPLRRHPANINVRIHGVNGSKLRDYLSNYGICISTGSACSQSNPLAPPSHVLTSIGLSDEAARECIRITLSPEITKMDIDYVIEKISNYVKEKNR